MKLLYITPAFQHPKVRGPNRHYHLVRELAQRHAITLLALNRAELPAEAVDEVAGFVEQLHVIDLEGAGISAAKRPGRLSGARRRVGQMWQMRQAVRRMTRTFHHLVTANSYDVIVFHGKSIFSVLEKSPPIPLVIDFCDATSMRIRSKLRYAPFAHRLALWLRYAEMRGIERRMLERTPHVAFIAPRDREAILGPGEQGEILPNGVDHHFWRRSSGPSQRHCLVLTGVMDYAPNHDAAVQLIERIAPQVRLTIPDLEILIVGRDPAPSLRALAASTPGIEVTGFVDDVRPYLERAAVFAAPLRYASGTQNKVLEAMSMEVPVVTTSVVADGLRMDGATVPPVRVADDETQFAAEVVQLLQAAQERELLAERGREFVENHFIWSRSAEKLESMCLAALGSKRHERELLGVTP